jgi:hypothetical protein
MLHNHRNTKLDLEPLWVHLKENIPESSFKNDKDRLSDTWWRDERLKEGESLPLATDTTNVSADMKALALPQIVRSGQRAHKGLLISNGSLWDVFRQIYEFELGYRMAVVVHYPPAT